MKRGDVVRFKNKKLHEYHGEGTVVTVKQLSKETIIVKHKTTETTGWSEKYKTI